MSDYYIHILDLTRSSCENCNYWRQAGIKLAALQFQCIALITELQSLVAKSQPQIRVSTLYTRVMPTCGIRVINPNFQGSRST
jgi:hypothetical protein